MNDSMVTGCWNGEGLNIREMSRMEAGRELSPIPKDAKTALPPSRPSPSLAAESFRTVRWPETSAVYWSQVSTRGFLYGLPPHESLIE